MTQFIYIIFYFIFFFFWLALSAIAPLLELDWHDSCAKREIKRGYATAETKQKIMPNISCAVWNRRKCSTNWNISNSSRSCGNWSTEPKSFARNFSGSNMVGIHCALFTATMYMYQCTYLLVCSVHFCQQRKNNGMKMKRILIKIKCVVVRFRWSVGAASGSPTRRKVAVATPKKPLGTHQMVWRR